MNGTKLVGVCEMTHLRSTCPAATLSLFVVFLLDAMPSVLAALPEGRSSDCAGDSDA